MKLTISNLGKQYRPDFWGLQEFSLDVQPGILGLLGPNGAGKSTFMRMLATITKVGLPRHHRGKPAPYFHIGSVGACGDCGIWSCA